MILYISIFLISCLLLFATGKILVSALSRIARFLKWKEFVVAFIVIALAASIPNLFVGITAALHGIPELSFGEIMGGNLIDMTIAVALAALFAKGLPAESRTVQTSSIFTLVVAILPLLLIFDGKLGRGDGLILIGVFFIYISWMFSKKERFSKVYDDERKVVKGFKVFIKDIGRILLSLLFLLLAAQGMVISASYFSEALNLSMACIGLLIVGLGNAIPETYFAILAARRAENWMILGDLMGSVIVAASLVLGTVALIKPIEIVDFSPFAIARAFLVISAVFFFFFVRTEKRLVIKEALFLLFLYILFAFFEFFFN